MFKKVILFLGVVLFLSAPSWAQTYSFANPTAYDYYEIQPDNAGLYCLFNASAKKAPNAVFRKVLLDQDLRPIDSVNYSIDGKAKLLASCSDEKFVTHAFYSKANGVEKIVFVIADPSGRIQNTFSKVASDFLGCFPKPIKKLKNFNFSFVVNNGSPGVLIVQPFGVTGSYLTRGRIIAFDMEGRKLWTCTEPALYQTQTTDKLLVGLVNTANLYAKNPMFQIAFIDKTSGNIIKKIPFEARGRGYRTVPVFATNGVDLMLAGSEYESSNGKDGKFYMSMFNLSGERIFDQVDTSALLSTRRLHIMGNVFDPDGNLVLIGEGWKPDATRAIAATATSILLTAMVGGGYTRVYTQVDHKVENVVFATLSPLDGKLKNLKTFPVGPWLNYGRLLTQDTHILFLVNRQVLIYDASDPNVAPTMLTSLRVNENLTLLPSGPVVIKKEKNRCTLSRLH